MRGFLSDVKILLLALPSVETTVFLIITVSFLQIRHTTVFPEMVFNPSLEEQAAASAVASLSGKRSRDGADAAGGFIATKMARVDALIHFSEMPAILHMPAIPQIPTLPGFSVTESTADSELKHVPKLQAAPFFFYNDFSRDVDPDPLTPLTPPGRVPNFPAKMHAILARPDLADIIAWMPHGRSWRVLKPREFEVRVLPTFFEHSKFSSFIRQANGWGFRRVTQGRDRNSYYHELFLRGLPHLCKQMKRPGVSEKRPADAEHELELYEISDVFPVPEKANDDSIMLECTVQGGPKARMPIYTGSLLSAESLRLIHGAPDLMKQTNSSEAALTPHDHSSLFSFHRAISASDNQICRNNHQEQNLPVVPFNQNFFMPLNSFGNAPPVVPEPTPFNTSMENPNNVAFGVPMQHTAYHTQHTGTPVSGNMNYQASCATSQFAAGFAAASALSSSHIRNVLGQALAANQNFQQFQQVQSPVPAPVIVVQQAE